MTPLYSDYKGYQYGIDGCARIATEFYALEKAAKISYRAIDLAGVLKGKIPTPFVFLSSQLKDLVLVIESTRLFCVSYPLFVRDKKGRSFFQMKPKIQIAEKVSLTAHLCLKTLAGADRVKLIRLGMIGTYAIGYMSVFKWALEGFILMYNFFGVWDGMKALTGATSQLEIAQNKIEKWNDRKHLIPQMRVENPVEFKQLDRWSMKDVSLKERKWEIVRNKMQIDQTKAWLKIAAKLSKFILICFAVTMAAINVTTNPSYIVILSLGIISDGLALIRFFYQEYNVSLNIKL